MNIMEYWCKEEESKLYLGKHMEFLITIERVTLLLVFFEFKTFLSVSQFCFYILISVSSCLVMQNNKQPFLKPHIQGFPHGGPPITTLSLSIKALSPHKNFQKTIGKTEAHCSQKIAYC